MKRAPARGKRRGSARATFETVRQIARTLPGAEEGTCFGTPAFRVRGKLFARLREDGETLVVKIDFDERELLMEAEPKSFFITDHYRNYPTMLVRLPVVHPDALRALVEESWRRSASKRLIEAFDRRTGAKGDSQ